MNQGKPTIIRQLLGHSIPANIVDLNYTGTSIPELLLNRVKCSPNKIAFYKEAPSVGWQSVTWRDYATAVERVAHSLSRMGLTKGDAIAIAIPTCYEWDLLNMAALRLGAVVVGIAPDTAPGIAASIVIETQCRCLILTDRHQYVAWGLQSETGQFIVTMSNISEFSGDFLRVVSFDALSRAAAPLNVESSQALPPFPEGSDPATIVFTSGTTGNPKGILYSHSQLLQAAHSILGVLPLNAADTGLCWLPMSSLFQRMINLLALATGSTLFFIRNPNELIQQLPQIRPTFLFGVPRFYEKLRLHILERMESPCCRPPLPPRSFVNLVAQHRFWLEKWPIFRPLLATCDRSLFAPLRNLLGGRIRFMITGSAPIAKELVEWFNGIGLNLLEAYALSENAIPMSMNELDTNRPGSVGKPLRANEIRIAEDGEILVRGPGVFSGYYNGENQEKCLNEGFYRTGDLGYFDEDGFLYLNGRQSDIVKSSTGRKLPLVQIEKQYKTIPYIEDVVAIGYGRKCVAGLLTIDRTKLSQIVPEERTADGGLPPGMKKQIARDIALAGLDLPAYQRIRAFAVLNESFSIANGALTGSLKLRRRFIEQQYSPIIETLYLKLETPHLSGLGVDHKDCYLSWV
jgi:long-chain acyl-CoA synthetase